MTKIIIILSLVISITAGCAPSRKYFSDGQFYSERFTKNEIRNMEAAKTVNVQHLMFSSGGCGAYSTQAADQKFVIEPIKQKMFETDALAVTNIRVSEKFALDFALGFLIVPFFAGCSNWDVEGNFYKAALGTTTGKPSTFNTPEKATDNIKEMSSGKPVQKDDSARLQKLKDMRTSGVITDEEYKKKKQEILDAM
jgi:Short C-terminal domain